METGLTSQFKFHATVLRMSQLMITEDVLIALASGEESEGYAFGSVCLSVCLSVRMRKLKKLLLRIT